MTTTQETLPGFEWTTDPRELVLASGYTFEWGEDWEVLDHVVEFDGYDHEPTTCEFVVLKDPAGDVVASLGCIDDADDEYRRTVERVLAAEIMP